MKKRGLTPGRLAAVIAAVAVAAVLAWSFLGGGGQTDAVAAGGTMGPDGAGPVAAPAYAAAPGPEVSGIRIDLYAGESGLTGVELMEKGDLDGAEKWLRNYLVAPDGREGLALYALGKVCVTQGRLREAADAFDVLARDLEASLRAGDALYELGLIHSESGRPDEARHCFRKALKYAYGRSERGRGGLLAARRLADELHERHVASPKPRRSEWERVRDLYSIALRGLDGDDPARAEMIARLDRLNQWVIFTPYSRPRAGYPSNTTFHTVKHRDTLGVIARRYGVPIGSIRRLNGIENNIIRPDDELKILRGRCEVFVDLSRLRLTVWIGGCFFREYAVGIGRDGMTPPGTFRIVTRIDNPHWWKDGESIPPGDPRNILGTRWLGFARRGPGRGIGIHGAVLEDGAWAGVGEAASNGCIRMANPDVEELFDFAAVGTEVTIVE